MILVKLYILLGLLVSLELSILCRRDGDTIPHFSIHLLAIILWPAFLFLLYDILGIDWHDKIIGFICNILNYTNKFLIGEIK